MIINMIGSFVRNYPFGTEIAFAKGLRQLGCVVNTWDPSSNNPPLDEGDHDADATIIFKDHGEKTYNFLRDIKESGQVVIEYQPDDIRAPGIKNMMKEMREFCDYAFTFDDEGARVAQEELGYLKAQKLLVTADPDVYYPIDNVEKDIDFCFVGSLSNPVMHRSRNMMIDYLREAGFQVKIANFYDVNIINILYNRSKVVLNHATDVGQEFGTGYGYQCRHFEAGMSGACLLSNDLLPPFAAKIELIDFMTFDSREGLINSANICMKDEYWKDVGSWFHKEVITEHSPAKRAHEIIKFIKSVR